MVLVERFESVMLKAIQYVWADLFQEPNSLVVPLCFHRSWWLGWLLDVVVMFGSYEINCRADKLKNIV
jgi:hypothetical protein